MKFEVRALGREAVTTLLVDAVDESDARRQVVAQALRPLVVKRRAGIAARRGPEFSLLLFTQELLTLLEAGLGIVESFETMLEKESRPDARALLAQLLAALREGRGLSASLESQGAAFPRLYVSIVRAAERTGNLPQALARYVEYRSRIDAAKARVVSASLYPLILLTAGLAVTLFLLGYVVPRFAGVYLESGRDIPWLSAQLMAFGRWLGGHRETALLGVLAVAGGIAAFLRQAAARQWLLRLPLRLPVLAANARTFQLARLYMALGMLLDGGMPAAQGLALVADTVSPEMRAEILAAEAAIRRGESLSRAFEQNALTTPVGLRLLRVGEQSGRMGETMGRIARLYDAEIARFIERFSRLFEPALMAGIGLFVGGVVVLLYLPIFDLAGSLQ